MILVIYFLKVINEINGTKNIKEKVNQTQKTLRPRRLKGDDEHLCDISPFFIFKVGLKMQMRI